MNKNTKESYDIIIIKMKKNDGFNFDAFLEIDDSIYIQKSYEYYKQRTIYLIHYPKGNNNAEFSVGNFINISVDNNTIEYTCNIDSGSSGSPILNLITHIIIGIHKGAGKINDYNVGTFIKNL
jgi:V8-like Glu-specific endopeptidase